jgi:hypothetical protein
MRPFVAAYVTSGGKEWDRPLCVANTTAECKQKFCDWYANVDHNDCSVRYALVTVVEMENE